MATADHEATTRDSSSGGPLLVWDSGSVLYDSYELTAFKRQLDAAVLAGSRRSLSMPHLASSVAAATSPPTADLQQQQQARRQRRRRRLPALLRKLFSKVLRLRQLFAATGARGARYRTGTGDDGAGSPWSGALTSIPEEQSSSSHDEMAAESPVDEPAASKLRKTQSERFIGSKTASSMVQFEVVL